MCFKGFVTIIYTTKKNYEQVFLTGSAEKWLKETCLCRICPKRKLKQMKNPRIDGSSWLVLRTEGQGQAHALREEGHTAPQLSFPPP